MQDIQAFVGRVQNLFNFNGVPRIQARQESLMGQSVDPAKSIKRLQEACDCFIDFGIVARRAAADKIEKKSVKRAPAMEGGSRN